MFCNESNGPFLGLRDRWPTVGIISGWNLKAGRGKLLSFCTYKETLRKMEMPEFCR